MKSVSLDESACTLNSIAHRAEPEAETGGDSSGFRRVRLGMCEDYPEASSSLAEIRRDMELLARSGLRVLRISVPWGDVQVGAGQYRWEFLDQFINTATEEFGLTLIPYVCYTPQWISQGRMREDYWRCPPRDYAEFGTFMRELASRYRGQIGSWEIWNEPDHRDFWVGSDAEYAAMLKVGSQGVRQGDPQAKIVLGGIAWNTAFLLRMFKEHGAGDEVDAVNLHNYYETWVDEPAERVVDYVNRAWDIVAQYGRNQALWMAEIGYSTYRRGGYVSADCRANYSYEHTPEYQASHLVRMMASMLSTEKLETIAWYELRELPASAAVIGDVNNRHLGVTNQNLEGKPALEAMVFVTQLLSSPHRCIDERVSVLRPIRCDSEVHCFECQDGRLVVAAWLKTRTSGRLVWRPDGALQDARRESIELALPMNGAMKAVLYDAMGTPRQQMRIDPGGGLARVRCHLRGGEAAVIEFRRIEEE